MEPAPPANQVQPQGSNLGASRADSSAHTKKPELRILVIGRCGSGKSTLINLMMNFLYSKRYTDDRIILVTQLLEIFNPRPVMGASPKKEQINCHPDFVNQQSDTLLKNSTEQTLVVNKYKIDLPQYSFSLIDTPGLENNPIIQNVANDIIKFGQVHAVFYTHKDGDVRQDPIFKTIHGEFTKVLPKNFKDNFFVIFSRCDPKVAFPRSQQFLASEYGYPMTKRFRFELSCLTPESILRKNAMNPQEADLLVTAAQKSWMENKTEYDQMMKSIQELVPRLLQDSQSSFRQPSANLKQNSMEDEFMRQYTGGGKGAVDPEQELHKAKQEIISSSQQAIEEIFNYCQEDNPGKKTDIHDAIIKLLTRILTAVPKVRDQGDINYFTAAVDQRMNEIDREKGMSLKSKSELKDMFNNFKNRYLQLKAQGTGLNTAAGVVASGDGASQLTLKNNFKKGEEIGRKDGGYIRPRGTIEDVPKPKNQPAGSGALPYINPQVSHLNFFIK